MKRIVFISVMFMTLMSCPLLSQNSNIFRYKVGDLEVIMLSENQGKGNASILLNITDQIKSETMPDGSFPNAVCAFVVKGKDKNVLIDAGFGRNLFDNLKAVGLTPKDIDEVLLTHLHGDHTGGLISNNDAAFINARLHIAKKEYDYWREQDESVMERVKYYTGSISLFDAGSPSSMTPITDGIYAIAAPGHTPGHTLFMIESSGKKLLIWGDLVHAMAVQMPYPEVYVTYDVDPDLATESRKEVLEYVVKNKIPVGGMHIAYPGIGKIEKNGKGGYKFTGSK